MICSVKNQAITESIMFQVTVDAKDPDFVSSSGTFGLVTLGNCGDKAQVCFE